MAYAARFSAKGRKPAIPRWRRVGPLAVVLVAVAALAAACGGGSKNTASSSPNAASAQSSASQSGVLFASCMRAHGVSNFPDSAVSVSGGQLELHVPGYLKSEPEFRVGVQGVPARSPRGRRFGKAEREHPGGTRVRELHARPRDHRLPRPPARRRFRHPGQHQLTTVRGGRKRLSDEARIPGGSCGLERIVSMGSLTSTATETAGVAGAGPRLRHRLRGVLVIGAVVLAAAAAAVTIAHLFASTASVRAALPAAPR